MRKRLPTLNLKNILIGLVIIGAAVAASRPQTRAFTRKHFGTVRINGFRAFDRMLKRGKHALQQTGI